MKNISKLNNKGKIENESIHIPVLLQEVIDGLQLKKGLIVFDGTLGGGGYAEKILENIGSDGILIGTDLNHRAIDKVQKRLEKFSNKKYFFQENFLKIDNILEKLSIKKVDRIVLDLGLSSDELEENQGISFQKIDDKLDMRFGKTTLTAIDILNNYTEEELADLFYFYGGERGSRLVAKEIIESRKKRKIEKVSDLLRIIEKSIGKFYKNKRIHYATKIFQALRIEVNDEIGGLKKFLEKIPSIISENGLIAIVTFHSLEDSVVKKQFRKMEDAGLGKRVNKKVIKPSWDEIQKNRRARSGQLRIFKYYKYDN